MPRQATIQKEVVIEGKGLHRGETVKMRLLPSGENTGIVFRLLVDGEIREIPADYLLLTDRPLRSALGDSKHAVETVEHLLAAVYGLGITNIRIELNSCEPPACDGSALMLCEKMIEAGIVEQDVPARVLSIKRPIAVSGEGESSISAVPCSEGLRVSYTLSGKGLPDQHVEYIHSRENFLQTVAKARTFCRDFEAEALQSMPGVGKGATTENTLLVREEAPEEDQRFPFELASHKILDLLGDISLMGRQVQGHIICHRSGHVTNHAFVRTLMSETKKGQLSINEIKEILPYGYPFLLVDRILEMHSDRSVGLKNVTMNEPFFVGHFPGEPIMPGVLIIEAIAQAGAVFIYQNLPNKLVLFTGADKVKFRTRVIPGDQLILEVKAKNIKRNFGVVKGVATVNGETACEAEIKFMITDRQ